MHDNVRWQVEGWVLLAAAAVDEARLQARRLGAVRVKGVHRRQHDLAVQTAILGRESTKIRKQCRQ